LYFEIAKKPESSQARKVGWAMPTDHLEPQQKDFKLFNSINLYTNRSMFNNPNVHIIKSKWSVGIAHLTKQLFDRNPTIPVLKVGSINQWDFSL
jgi:hypothetical protein